MRNPLWLENVKQELRKRRLPRQEVARLVAELSDHLADLDLSDGTGSSSARRSANACVPCGKDAVMSMDATVANCLGSPEEIATVAEQQFRRRGLLNRSWLARFCTFVLLPAPALILLWVATFLGLYLLTQLGETVGIQDPGPPKVVTFGLALAADLAYFAILLIPATALTAAYVRLARKTGNAWRWGLAACLLVALLTASTHYKVTWSDIPGKSTIEFGLGIGQNLLTYSHVGRFVIPLAVGVLMLRRSQRAAVV